MRQNTEVTLTCRGFCCWPCSKHLSKLTVRNLTELGKLDLTHPYGTRKSNDNTENCQLVLEVSQESKSSPENWFIEPN